MFKTIKNKNLSTHYNTAYFNLTGSIYRDPSFVCHMAGLINWT